MLDRSNTSNPLPNTVAPVHCGSQARQAPGVTKTNRGLGAELVLLYPWDDNRGDGMYEVSSGALWPLEPRGR